MMALRCTLLASWRVAYRLGWTASSPDDEYDDNERWLDEELKSLEEARRKKEEDEKKMEKMVAHPYLGEFMTGFKEVEKRIVVDKEVQEAVDDLLGLVVNENLCLEDILPHIGKLQG